MRMSSGQFRFSARIQRRASPIRSILYSRHCTTSHTTPTFTDRRSILLEFDINMYMNGIGFLWGTQCRIAGGHEWDTWDDPTAHWVPTGIACNPVDNGWNHVTIQVQRASDNTLLYQSISLNGVTANLKKTTQPFSVPGGWWGVTANYQMDGNYKQSSNTTYLDNLSFTYW